jgi:thiamine pyrophosphate-dependent acetolactate synthase large subunit-like protein
MKFHAALARALADNGVSVMFGVAGDANLYVIDAFARNHNGSYIAAANEVGAVLMALGYGSVSGRLGVATVTHGPGLANTVTGLIEGVKGQAPMLLIAGDTAADDRDNAQNIAQRELVLATGAGIEQLRAPKTLARDVAMAIQRAQAERRPIVLNVPVEF